MPNLIKYSTSAQTLALKSGDYWIGTGDVPKGPTSSSDYWNGITPPSGGYTIYLNKASQGPSIYTPLSDSDLIVTTNMIAQTSFTTTTECFNWFNTQSDKMVFNIDYPPIITNGLVLNLDAGFRPSYSTSGATWYDLSPNGNNGTLVNGPTFNSGNGGSIVFDGTNDYVNMGSKFDLPAATFSFWIKLDNSIVGTYSGNQRPWGKNGLFESRWGGSVPVDNARYSCDIGANNSLYSNKNEWLNTIWYNIVVTYNSAINSSILYVQGQQDATGTAINPSGLSGDFTIGATYGTAGYIDGNISQFQIYNRALTATEIQQNYNAQKSKFGL